MGRVAGIEPTSQDSESCALSFELHAHKMLVLVRHQMLGTARQISTDIYALRSGVLYALS